MAECTIGPGIIVNGRVTGNAAVFVLGRLEGEVVLDSEFVVQPGGIVVANVEADNISIHGTLNGTIVARDTVRLCAGCAVTGDIRAPTVVVEQGARLMGDVDMDVQIPN